MGKRIHRPGGLSDIKELLRLNVKDSRHGVRQASFALLGHLVNASFELVSNHLGSTYLGVSFKFFFGWISS